MRTLMDAIFSRVGSPGPVEEGIEKNPILNTYTLFSQYFIGKIKMFNNPYIFLHWSQLVYKIWPYIIFSDDELQSIGI